MQSVKPQTIAVVVDERVSREKARILARTINALRRNIKIDLLAGAISEDEMLKKVQENAYSLVLVPWYRYLQWSRVEAFYGNTRTSGPAFAGYFADQVKPYEFGEQAGRLRTTLLDFSNLESEEVLKIMGSIISEHQRSGIQPLLTKNTKIYSETWISGQGLGSRFDTLLSLPDVKSTDWAKRSSALRICLGALWSLVYEEGPGKFDFQSGNAAKAARAHFEFATDAEALYMRLIYGMPGISPKDCGSLFWPDPRLPTAPAQLLLQFADLIRVHTIAGTNEIEIVAGFFPSAPSEKAPGHAHTLWVEPIAKQLFREAPNEAANNVWARVPLLMQEVQMRQSAQPGSTAGTIESQIKIKDRFLFEAAVKIRELKREIAEKDQLIQELKSGGVGTAPTLPPPDAESLLEAFQERYFQSKYEIHQLELQIEQALADGSGQTVPALKQKMTALIQRETELLNKLAPILDQLRGETTKKAQ